VGTVLQIGDGVARVYGLPRHDERSSWIPPWRVRHGPDLEEDNVGCILFGESHEISEGDTVKRTGRVAPCLSRADARAGRKPLGQPIDGRGPVRTEKISRSSGRRSASYSDSRQGASADRVEAVDGMIPIGRGQRELIIGDRQTGKPRSRSTRIINQKYSHTEKAKREGVKPVYCIYVAVGQKSSHCRPGGRQAPAGGGDEYTTIIAATAADPAPMQFIAHTRERRSANSSATAAATRSSSTTT